MNLSGKTILCTGHAGFLGQHLCRALEARGALVQGARSADYDLTNPGHAHGLLNRVKPDVVIHAAAKVGGILANKNHPYQFGRDNLLMGINVLDACIRHQIPKVVFIGTTCSYPMSPPSFPFPEDELWSGHAEPTNAPYGHAKRILASLVEAAVHEGMLSCGTTAILANLYGPGDNFCPETSHAIPAIVRKMCEAVDTGRDSVQLWGSGRATRDFLNVKDASEGICRVCEAWDLPIPINLGTGKEVSIKEMAETVAELVGFKGLIRWSEGDGLDGQQHRALDCTRAWNGIGWEPRIEFRDGLQEVVQWWRDQNATVPS